MSSNERPDPSGEGVMGREEAVSSEEAEKRSAFAELFKTLVDWNRKQGQRPTRPFVTMFPAVSEAGVESNYVFTFHPTYPDRSGLPRILVINFGTEHEWTQQVIASAYWNGEKPIVGFIDEATVGELSYDETWLAQTAVSVLQSDFEQVSPSGRLN